LAWTKSIKLFKAARKFLVGGVSSPVRSFVSIGGHPLIIDRGEGARIFDADGNSYTDYCLSWGALILGHGPRDVQGVLQGAIENGSSFGTTHRVEIELAKFIVKHVPSIDLVRFVNSGTEAAMSAIRLARGFTQKRIVAKFDGCYHGHVDDLLTKAGSGVAKLQESSSQGIPRSHIQNALSLPFNDTAVLTDVLNRFYKDIACVIIEPVAGNMGVVPAKKDFLKVLRYLTKKYNIVLIFDEIMTGFRTGLGCVQAQLEIVPDMTCLGKIIGGGFPIGAYGGRREIMECLAPLGGVYQAGTFSGNPVVLSAGLATLKNLSPGFFRRLNRRAERFAGKLNDYFKKYRLPVFLSSYGSMMSLRFQPQAVLNYEEARNASCGQLYSKLFWHLLKNGIYWPPADLEAFFLSGAHSDQDLSHLTACLKKFFRKEAEKNGRKHLRGSNGSVE